jgi:hypothetical protein
MMDKKRQEAKLAVLRHLGGVMGHLEAKKIQGHQMPPVEAQASKQGNVEMQADGASPIGEGEQMADHVPMEGITEDHDTAPHMVNARNPEHTPQHPEYSDEDMENLHDLYSKLKD